MEKVVVPQLPTCRGVYLTSVEEAHMLFYAVKEGILPMVHRNMTSTERAFIRSGDVFVWEAQDRSVMGAAAMRRFIDGIDWIRDGHRRVCAGSPRGILPLIIIGSVLLYAASGER
jgi:hypothetical protein